MENSFQEVFHYISFSMLIDLSIAFIPLVSSFYLFRTTKKIHFTFWLFIFMLFLVFLPNAGYTITDYIQMLADCKTFDNPLFKFLFIIPVYILYMLISFESYTLSIILLDRFLKRKNFVRVSFIIFVEIIINFYCSIGIFLGRFEKIDIWELLIKPIYVFEKTFLAITNLASMITILKIFLIITFLYYAFKFGNIFLWKELKKMLKEQKRVR